MIFSASLSCGPQSHFNEPNTSPVRHSLCSRTSAGAPPNAPITRATCSCPSSDARKATIWVSGKSSSGSLARATSSTVGGLSISATETLAASRPRIEQPQRREQSGGPRQPQGRARGLGAIRRERMKRPDRPAVHVAAGVGERERGIGIEPRRALDQHRLGRVGGVAHVGQCQSGGALAAQHERRRSVGIEQLQRLGRAGLDRKHGDRPVAIDPDRPPGAKRGDRAADRIAQISSSQIRGTWSDGRSHVRHGSSTSWATRWPASSGDAHM